MLYNKCYKKGDSMPPIPKISKDMILESGLKIIKEEGIDKLNVRNIASKLNCSTQPIMYHYKNMSLLKEELYSIVDNYHSQFLMKENINNNPLLNIGLQYIKFAVQEKNLFKFLFQSGKFSNFNFDDLIDNNEEGLKEIFKIIEKETKIDKKSIKEEFKLLFITAHGLASLLANNSINYNEKYCIDVLKKAFYKIN